MLHAMAFRRQELLGVSNDEFVRVQGLVGWRKSGSGFSSVMVDGGEEFEFHRLTMGRPGVGAMVGLAEQGS